MIINRSFKDFKFRHRSKKNQIIYTSKKVGNDEEILNLIDNLERSKQVLENDETLKNTDALKKTLEHLEIVNKDLISIFSKNDIKPIECLNKKLDPNLHQAMSEIEDESVDTGNIIEEIQSGYMLGERLLRPALVSVAKNKTGKKEENNQKKEDK